MSTRRALKVPSFLLAALLGAPNASGQGEPVAPPAPSYQSVILAVSVNGLPADPGVILLVNEEGHLLAPIEFFQDWNLRTDEARTPLANGTVYFDLDSIEQLGYHWDHGKAALTINAAPNAFTANQLNIGAAVAHEVLPYAPGAYLNYDFSWMNSPGFKHPQALLDGAVFGGTGLLISNFTAGAEGAVRLMTSYQTDQVDRLKTLRWGDSYNSTGFWGRGVLFGGVQWGSNFAIRPDFGPGSRLL
jgi:outer membrane usher protein